MAQMFRAGWVLPIATPPQRDGWVVVEDGVVLETGAADRTAARAALGPMDVVDLGRVAVLPGLVNAHTHLELSWMRDQLPPGPSMPEWASRLMALRRTVSREPFEPIADAVREVRAAGTALVGDVTNTLAA